MLSFRGFTRNCTVIFNLQSVNYFHWKLALVDFWISHYLKLLSGGVWRQNLYVKPYFGVTQHHIWKYSVSTSCSHRMTRNQHCYTCYTLLHWGPTKTSKKANTMQEIQFHTLLKVYQTKITTLHEILETIHVSFPITPHISHTRTSRHSTNPPTYAFK